MGCVCSNGNSEERSEEPLNEESVVKQYTWDKRESIRQKENILTIIQKIEEDSSVRLPGSASGHQLVIQDCQKSEIYIFDFLSSIVVENCSDCQMFLGPTETGITLKDCYRCTVLCACQQLLVKNSNQLNLSLCCASRPILENSKEIKFSCFEFYYSQLEDHMHRAQLSVYNNFWSHVYDASFSSNEKQNFEISMEEPNIKDLITVPEVFEKVGVRLSWRETIVPFMPPTRHPTNDKSCLVMFFNDGLSHDRARTFIRLMKENHPECRLIQGREVLLKEAESAEIFNSDKYATAIKQGPVIGLEYQGEDCRHFCQETLVTVSKGSTGLVFISSAKELSKKQVDAFRRFSDSKLGNIRTPDAYRKKI